MAITARRRAGRVAAAVCLALPALSAQAAYVVVDTGHTPARPATGASGRVEYQYNLVLSGAVAARLTALGERVKRVAADGAEVSLGQRSRLAPDADFFISIHHDSMQQKYIDAGRQREFAGFDLCLAAQSPLRGKPALRQGDRRSAGGGGREAVAVSRRAHRRREPPLLDRRLGVHRFDGLAVLKTATMPAVLVEAGVIVNPDDEARVARPDTIERMARAISDGVHACLGG